MSDRAPHATRARWLGRAGLALATSALALGGAEAVLRYRVATDDAPGSDDDWRRRYRHMNEAIYRRSDDPALIYEPRPGASVEMEYGPAGFDAGGLREDRDVPRAPREGVVRVAMLGDSLVWSEFLAVHDSVPRRTEEALGAGFEVLNAGVTGYDTAQEAAWYERAVRPYHPAVVVLVWCMNDLMIMSGPFERFATPRERADKDAQEALMERVAPVRRETIDAVIDAREREASVLLFARAWGLFERWRFSRAYVDEYLVAFSEEPRRARVRAALRRLGRALEADGARGLLVISPVLEAWDDYPWRPIHDFVAAAARAAGFTVLDPLDAWRAASERPEDMRISGDNLHYDGSGARALAAAVAPAIRELAR
ncbi:MAG: SGNH/GDSL hydrolase family protein [Sandaracinaceae bacterium]|nr:SGNH/GDSL hydrolase family protein [Sandaracinaceae bacterium]